MRSRISHSLKRKIAFDYYFGNLNKNQLMIKYGVSRWTVNSSTYSYPRSLLIKEICKRDDSVFIKLNREDVERAAICLSDKNISYKIPTDIIIEQQFKSKL